MRNDFDGVMLVVLVTTLQFCLIAYFIYDVVDDLTVKLEHSVCHYYIHEGTKVKHCDKEIFTREEKL